MTKKAGQLELNKLMQFKKKDAFLAPGQTNSGTSRSAISASCSTITLPNVSCSKAMSLLTE